MEFDEQEQRTKEFQRIEPANLDDTASPVAPPHVLAYLGISKQPDKTSAEQEMSLDQLVAALDNQDWMVRVATVRKLGKFKQRAPVELSSSIELSSIEPLYTILCTDEHQAVRAAVAQALGRLQAISSIVHLIAALQDSSWHVRAAAATALGKLGELVPAEPLVAALADEDDSVRAAAIWAVGQLGSRTPLAPILAALHDSAWQVRETAARTLGKLGAQAAREPLLLALNDKDEQVREAATWALQQIPVELFPFNEQHQTGEQETGAIRPVSRATGPIIQYLPLLSKERDRASQKQPDEQEIHEDRSPLPIIKSERSISREREDERIAMPTPRRLPVPARRTAFQRNVERALVAVLIGAIGLSWLLVSHWPGTTTGSGDNLDNTTAFSYQMPSGAVSDLVWAAPSITHGENNLVAFATDNGWVQIWNTSSKTLITTYGPFKKVLAMNWPASGLQIAVLTNAGTLQLIGEENMQPAFSQPYAQSTPPLVSLSPDGKRMAVTTQTNHQGVVNVWTLATHTSIVVRPSQPGEITSLAWSNDNSELATASDNGQMRIIDIWSATQGMPIADPMTVPYVPVPFRVLNMAWSSDGVHLAYALDDGEVRVWDRRSYNHLLFHSTADQTTTSNWSALVAWSPDGKRVATTTQHGSIQIWDATTGDLLSTYQGHRQQVNALTWSSDGKRIASADMNGLVLVWKED